MDGNSLHSTLDPRYNEQSFGHLSSLVRTFGGSHHVSFLGCLRSNLGGGEGNDAVLSMSHIHLDISSCCDEWYAGSRLE